MTLQRTEPPAGKGDERYRMLWTIVDQAVGDAFAQHPAYLTDAGRQSAQVSINKRVVAALLKFIGDSPAKPTTSI